MHKNVLNTTVLVDYTYLNYQKVMNIQLFELKPDLLTFVISLEAKLFELEQISCLNFVGCSNAFSDWLERL